MMIYFALHYINLMLRLWQMMFYGNLRHW